MSCTYRFLRGSDHGKRATKNLREKEMRKKEMRRRKGVLFIVVALVLHIGDSFGWIV